MAKVAKKKPYRGNGAKAKAPKPKRSRSVFEVMRDLVVAETFEERGYAAARKMAAQFTPKLLILALTARTV
jgi:hypothetical protein